MLGYKYGIMLILLVATCLAGPGELFADWNEVGTPLGSIRIPDAWTIGVNGDSVIARSDDTLSKVSLYSMVYESKSAYLHVRAQELGISDYVRPVSSEYLEELGMVSGAFILGTATVPADTVSSGAPSNENENSGALNEQSAPDTRAAAAYRFLLVYETGKRLYVLEAETYDIDGAAITLSDIQRSWRPPQR